MNHFYFLFTLVFVGICSSIYASQSPALLPSTEGDPDTFIEHCVCVINGDYCESATDIAIAGPDILLLQRYYNTKNYLTGEDVGGWRIFPQLFLILGEHIQAVDYPKDPQGRKRIRAYTGDRSGGVFCYSGLGLDNTFAKDPLRIDLLKDGVGMVNTYAKELNGQTNHQNNQLYCHGETCELVLGDGTHRLYQKVKSLPTLILGEELNPYFAAQVKIPEFFCLIEETLPSGNRLLFSYDSEGHLALIEMKNSTLEKCHAWLSFTHEMLPNGYLVHVESSDEKSLEYHFTLKSLSNGLTTYALTDVIGSHLISCSYMYQVKDQLCFLVKKVLPENRYVEIDYEPQGKVTSLKFPHPSSGRPHERYFFDYCEGYTDVWDSMGVKTTYQYDSRKQLTTIRRFDSQERLYRTDNKIWGTENENIGLLLGKTIADGSQAKRSYCSYRYDAYGNVLEKKLYGNLSGQDTISISLDDHNKLINAEKIECHTSLYIYSSDGLNLLTLSGDVKGINTYYCYKPGTNLRVKEFFREGNKILKRTFQTYDEDAVCVRVIVDDGNCEDENSYVGVSERHITYVTPKNSFPGVGLPEVFEVKCVDINSQSELLLKRSQNTFDDQGNLACTESYDSDNQFTYSEAKSYNHLGLVTSETDLYGKQTVYTYDGNGNRLSASMPYEDRLIEYTYDFRNQLTNTLEVVGSFAKEIKDTYDIKGRKVASIDQFGNVTRFSYDDFGRLSKVEFPAVINENAQLVAPTFHYAYDIFGNVISETDPCNYTTYKIYNLLGKPTCINYPDGTSERFKYHLSGTLHRALSREGIMTFFEYDSMGRTVIKHRSFPSEKPPGIFIDCQNNEYKGFRCTKITDRKLAVNYEFDPYGRVTQIVKYSDKGSPEDPDSQITELKYDSLGRVSTKLIWFGVGPQDYCKEIFRYDLAGNLLENEMVNADGEILLERGFVYDLCGRCIEEFALADGNKNTLIKTTYNALGDPVAYVDSSGNQFQIHIDYAFTNSIGQKVLKKTIVSPLGAQTEIEFDALGRVVCVMKKDSLGMSLSRQRLFYDACGNKCCEIQDQIVNGIWIGKKTSRWTYGPMGRIEEEFEACDTQEEMCVKYSYNSLGQLATKSVPDSSVPLKYTYGWNGRLEQIEHDDKSKLPNQAICHKYQYNDRGNIVRAQDLLNRSTIERKYDIFEQLISESVQVEFKKYIVEYSYDRKGRIRSVTLPDKSSVEYHYESIFGKEVCRLSPNKEVLYRHIYDEYDGNGKLLIERLVGRVGKKDYEYDSSGCLKSVHVNEINFKDKGDHDELGRLINMEQIGPQGLTKRQFTYNELSQLTEESGDNPCDYSYDSLDNRLSKNGDKIVYKSLFQLQSYSDTYLTHNLDGNLASKSSGQEKLKFESNALSEIVQIDRSDQKRVSYLYDPLGRCLLRKLIDTKTKKMLSNERLIFLGDQEIGTLDDNNKIQQLRIPGIEGEQFSSRSIGIELKGQYYAPIHSLDGNLIALVDPLSSDIVESYSYTAFGEETIYDSLGIPGKESKLSNPWRYREKRKDSTTGLLLFGCRYYDPEVGRWITPDPLGAHDGPNPYAYVRNNPMTNKDRLGFATEAIEKGKLEIYFYDNKEVYSYCFGDPWDRRCIIVRYPVKDGCKGTQLPTIRYDDNFEKMMGEVAPLHYKPSHVFDLQLPETSDLRIGFINGIMNQYANALEGVHYISRLAGGYNVHSVYNTTHGLSFDLLECDMGLNDYIATEPVRQLHKMWNSYFCQASSEGKFLQLCHSQGAIHVRNALLDYPDELRERIIVVAIAPGGYIYQQTCNAVTHYRAGPYRDPIPRIDRAGAQRSKDTIVDLESHPDASLFDHTFMSRTYENILIKRIRKYMKNSGK